MKVVVIPVGAAAANRLKNNPGWGWVQDPGPINRGPGFLI